MLDLQNQQFKKKEHAISNRRRVAAATAGNFCHIWYVRATGGYLLDKSWPASLHAARYPIDVRPIVYTFERIDLIHVPGRSNGCVHRVRLSYALHLIPATRVSIHRTILSLVLSFSSLCFNARSSFPRFALIGTPLRFQLLILLRW